MASHEVFSVLSDPTRLEVLARLARSGPATATELSTSLPVSRQAVAKHLAALNSVGLVERTRQGREVRYSFSAQPLEELARWATDVGQTWEERLDRLRRAIR